MPDPQSLPKDKQLAGSSPLYKSVLRDYLPSRKKIRGFPTAKANGSTAAGNTASGGNNVSNPVSQ
jgi:hypothetical protein